MTIKKKPRQRVIHKAVVYSWYREGEVEAVIKPLCETHVVYPLFTTEPSMVTCQLCTAIMEELIDDERTTCIA